MSVQPPTAGTHVPDPLAGTAYRTVEYLDQGNMGFVVVAKHLALDTEVVVKLIHPNLAERRDFVDRMRLEAQTMARLRSPHLTMCTDFGLTPAGLPYLVMERLRGRTVAAELKARGALPVEEAIDIARQTLAGLAVVHEAGLVHRDIKTSNLFLCDAPRGRRSVKILDFGIAKVLASAPEGAPKPLTFPTADGNVVGSPRYFSPEQAGGKTVDARTDLYGVGVLLYALLAGAGPFDHIRGILELMMAHTKLVPPPPSERARRSIPRELDAVVMKALAKRREDRFQSAVEFSDELARVALLVQGPPSAHELAPLHVDTAPLDDGDATEPNLVVPRFDTEVLPPAPPRSQDPDPSITLCAPPAPRLAPVAEDEATQHLPRQTFAQQVAPAAAPSPTIVHLPAPIQSRSLPLSVLVVLLSALVSATLVAVAARAWVLH